MPRLKGSANSLEYRRRQALELLDAGHSLNEVGRRIGCSASSVMRWRDARRHGGDAALEVRSSSGRPPKLTEEQKSRLAEFLNHGPIAHGFNTDPWTTNRVSDLIRHEFGVEYHRSNIGRLMHSLGWSVKNMEWHMQDLSETKIPVKRADEPLPVDKASRAWASNSYSRVSSQPSGYIS